MRERLKSKKGIIFRCKCNLEGRRLVDRKLVEAPSIFIAGRPKAALLFWFFGGFRCCVNYVLLFLLDIKIENK